MSGGQLSGGQLSGGQLSGGQLSGGQLSGGQLSGGQLSGGQRSGGQLSPTHEITHSVSPFFKFFLFNTYFTSVVPTALLLQCNWPITGIRRVL